MCATLALAHKLRHIGEQMVEEADSKTWPVHVCYGQNIRGYVPIDDEISNSNVLRKGVLVHYGIESTCVQQTDLPVGAKLQHEMYVSESGGNLTPTPAGRSSVEEVHTGYKMEDVVQELERKGQ